MKKFKLSKKWEPKEGEYYYCVSLGDAKGIHISRIKYIHIYFCKIDIAIGNYFKRQDQAEHMMRRIKRLLKKR